MIYYVLLFFFFFFFKQKTAYEMSVSDWSSDVCSSDLAERRPRAVHLMRAGAAHHLEGRLAEAQHAGSADRVRAQHAARWVDRQMRADLLLAAVDDLPALADVAEAKVLEPHRFEPGERDVDLGGVDLLPRVLDAGAVVDGLGAHLSR